MRDIEQQLFATIELLRTSADRFLVVESGPYYIQFLFDADEIYAEAVGNGYLEPAHQLGFRGELQLLELGWNLPDESCVSTCGSGHPNFHRCWPASTPTAEIVRTVLNTFAAVYLRYEGQPITIATGERAVDPATGEWASH